MDQYNAMLHILECIYYAKWNIRRENVYNILVIEMMTANVLLKMKKSKKSLRDLCMGSSARTNQSFDLEKCEEFYTNINSEWLPAIIEEWRDHRPYGGPIPAYSVGITNLKELKDSAFIQELYKSISNRDSIFTLVNIKIHILRHMGQGKMRDTFAYVAYLVNRYKFYAKELIIFFLAIYLISNVFPVINNIVNTLKPSFENEAIYYRELLALVGIFSTAFSTMVIQRTLNKVKRAIGAYAETSFQEKVQLIRSITTSLYALSAEWENLSYFFKYFMLSLKDLGIYMYIVYLIGVVYLSGGVYLGGAHLGNRVFQALIAN